MVTSREHFKFWVPHPYLRMAEAKALKFLPRDSYAKHVICRRRVFVCLSVCLSVCLCVCFVCVCHSPILYRNG